MHGKEYFGELLRFLFCLSSWQCFVVWGSSRCCNDQDEVSTEQMLYTIKKVWLKSLLVPCPLAVTIIELGGIARSDTHSKPGNCVIPQLSMSKAALMTFGIWLSLVTESF